MSKKTSDEVTEAAHAGEQADPGQVPTIGRIVLYKPTSTDAIHFRNWKDSEVLPAIIVMVWDATCVNLKVFDNGPTDALKTSVLLGDEPGQWNWPKR